MAIFTVCTGNTQCAVVLVIVWKVLENDILQSECLTQTDFLLPCFQSPFCREEQPYNNIGNIFVMNKKTKTVCHSFLLRIERPIIWSGIEVMVRLWRPANLQYFEVMCQMEVENEEYCFPLSNFGLSQSRFKSHTILFLTPQFH